MNEDPPAADTESVLNAWVDAQWAHWDKTSELRPEVGGGLSDPDEVLDRLNEAAREIFVFDIRDLKVTLLPKPRHYSAADMERSAHGFIKRAHQYREFFAAVVREFCPAVECRLAMSMDDKPFEPSTVPLFSFQKLRGSHAVLLPDIDAIEHRFYVGVADDTIPYTQKVNKAVFVGSTTGEIHTLQSVQALKNQRLKLGVFFQGNPDVIFKLPNVAQCDSPATEQAIRALGFGTGAMNWQQQLTYRFLLSADGNGATCSRVAIALKSNSVLLKFTSDYLLYYFEGLQPGVHYLSLEQPEEVAEIIRAERATPGLHAPIARAGSEFYQQFLTRTPVMRYTALLLERYARWMHPHRGTPAGTAPVGVFSAIPDFESRRSPVRATCVVHIRNRGDVTFDLGSWVGDFTGDGPLEGFQLSFQSGIPQGSLSCKVLLEAESEWVTAPNDRFIGSRSQSKAIRGLAFELTGDAAALYDCLYVGAFQDGSISPAYMNGEPCAAADHRPIKAFQVAFPLKRSAAPASGK